MLMGPGGLSINLFAPDPTEGVKTAVEVLRCAHSGRNPRGVPAGHGLRQEPDHPRVADQRSALASTPESLTATRVMESRGPPGADPGGRHDVARGVSAAPAG